MTEKKTSGVPGNTTGNCNMTCSAPGGSSCVDPQASGTETSRHQHSLLFLIAIIRMKKDSEPPHADE